MVTTDQPEFPAAKFLLAVLAFATITALAGWWLSPSQPQAYVRPVDLSESTFVEIRHHNGTVVMSGELRSHVDSLGGVEKDAALLGQRQERVIGEIEIEIPHAGATDPRQELEVDVISLEPRTRYHVVVDDQVVATFTTDDRGSVDQEFSFIPAR